MQTPDLTLRNAIDLGADSLAIIRRALARAMADIERLQAQYAEVDNPSAYAEVVAEALRLAACDFLPSLRLELAADAQAALAAAAAAQGSAA